MGRRYPGKAESAPASNVIVALSASSFQQRITFEEVYDQNVPKYAFTVFPKALCPLWVVTIQQCINLLVPVY